MDKNNTKSSTPVSLTEHLSALLDNEAGSFEQRRVLSELQSGDTLRKKLSSYALIGEVMRTSETTVTATPSFLSGIQDQIETDDDYHQVQVSGAVNDDNNNIDKQRKSSWIRPIGGFALAASVATVAFLGFQNYQNVNTGAVNTELLAAKTSTTNSAVLTENNITIAALSTTTNTAIEYQPADARARTFLKQYVDSHMQYATNTAFVPSVRVIGYAN